MKTQCLYDCTVHYKQPLIFYGTMTSWVQVNRCKIVLFIVACALNFQGPGNGTGLLERQRLQKLCTAYGNDWSGAWWFLDSHMLLFLFFFHMIPFCFPEGTITLSLWWSACRVIQVFNVNIKQRGDRRRSPAIATVWITDILSKTDVLDYLLQAPLCRNFATVNCY